MRELGIEFISVFGMDPRHSRPTSRRPYDRLTAGEGELPLLRPAWPLHGIGARTDRADLNGAQAPQSKSKENSE